MDNQHWYLFENIGKPRDERDPKVAELNKHIEEVVEKEQHLLNTESTIGITKWVSRIKKNLDNYISSRPVRILTAKSESSIDH